MIVLMNFLLCLIMDNTSPHTVCAVYKIVNVILTELLDSASMNKCISKNLNFNGH